MDSVWSQYIQGCMTLYTSRRLRFHDRFRDRYLPLFDLPAGPLRILEIGCGPGALAEALHRWYPLAEIIGVDRDREFVRFAREHVSGVEFREGDAVLRIGFRPTGGGRVQVLSWRMEKDWAEDDSLGNLWDGGF